jgi:hypothetical protein
MRTSPRMMLGLAAALLAASACETKKSSNPLSPSLAGPIPGVNITAPRPLEPSNGVKITQGTSINLLLENASTNGERPIWQQLEVALDPEFAQRVHYVERLDLGPNGRTSYHLPMTLDAGRGYYWRARAIDGANSGPYSTAAIFNIVVPSRIEAPVPISPVGGATISGQTPTLVVLNTAVIGIDAPVYIRFELASDAGFTRMLAVWTVPRSGGEQTTVTGSPLGLGGTYYWRASASDGNLTSPYSQGHAFSTPAPAPDPTPTPTPVPPGGGGGGGGPWPRNGEEVMAWAKSHYPSYLSPVGSLDERYANMEFLRDRMIEAGLCGGMQLAWNLKRGGPEISRDFLDERVGGEWHGIDVANDFDNYGHTLKLTWADTGPANGVFPTAYTGRLPCQ